MLSGVLVDRAFDAALERAFAVTARDLVQWPNPNPGADPPDEAYSRLSEPERWRIIGARADAWMLALFETGRADTERGVDQAVAWASPPGPFVVRTDVVRPRTDAAIELAVGRTRFGEVEGAGLVVGVGLPAIDIDLFPDCGYDACDWGSQPELDRLDELMASVVTGAFRHVVRGPHRITVRMDGARSWGSQGPWHLTSQQVDAILAAPEPPTGWREWRGERWGPSEPRTSSGQRTPR